MDTKIALQGEDITGRGRTVNPFLILDGAADFIRFAEEVFGATENREARTPTPSGALIHAEIALGDSLVLLSDPQPGWPFRPDCCRSGSPTSTASSPAPSSMADG
ncbi:MAG: hypothetical protein LBU78_04420 [Microbacterium sp.]|jgi:uncharacterized glyoxalase superfamily protein PhnB|nr:hypothetical protein [Microbacterium sp.]